MTAPGQRLCPGDGDFVLGPDCQLRQVWGDEARLFLIDPAPRYGEDGRRVPFEVQMPAIASEYAADAGTEAWLEAGDGSYTSISAGMFNRDIT